LLEDPDTGDVLMPLIYMKEILQSNYSRKLASLKNRLVTVPEEGLMGYKQEGLLYWQWAFESHQNIKHIVRQELGDEATPQGHLRLVLVPIIYNALAQKPELREIPLFTALHKAMKRSNYYQLLRPPEPEIIAELESTMPGIDIDPPLFPGPKDIKKTALKYVFFFKDHDEVEARKKLRTTAPPPSDVLVDTRRLSRDTLDQSYTNNEDGDDQNDNDDGDNDKNGSPERLKMKEMSVPQYLGGKGVPGSANANTAGDNTLDFLRRLVEEKFDEMQKEIDTLKHSLLSIYAMAIPHFSDPKPAVIPGYYGVVPPPMSMPIPMPAEFLAMHPPPPSAPPSLPHPVSYALPPKPQPSHFQPLVRPPAPSFPLSGEPAVNRNIPMAPPPAELGDGSDPSVATTVKYTHPAHLTNTNTSLDHMQSLLRSNPALASETAFIQAMFGQSQPAGIAEKREAEEQAAASLSLLARTTDPR